jgi:hypothetical protein
MIDEMTPQTLCAMVNGNPPDSVGSTVTPTDMNIPPNKKPRHPIRKITYMGILMNAVFLVLINEINCGSVKIEIPIEPINPT